MQLFVLFDWTILLTFLFLYRNYGRSSKSRKFELYQKYSNWSFLIFAFLIFLISSFRQPAFGGPDTINYCYYAEGDISSYYYTWDEIKDIGFIYLCNLFRLISKDYHFFIFWSSCLILLPLLYSIYRFAGDKMLGLAFFCITMPDIWIMSMCAIRQFLSISIVVTAFCVWKTEYKYKNYLSILLLVSSCIVHSSCIILVPLVLFFYFKSFTKKTLFICLAISWFAISFSDLYSDFMDAFASIFGGADESISRFADRYSSQSVAVNKTMLNMLPLNLIPACVLFFTKDKDVNRNLVQVYVLGFCLYDLLCKTQMGIRMTTLFIVIATICFPYVCNLKNELVIKGDSRKIFYRSIFVLFFYMCWRTTSMLNSYTSFRLDYWTYSFFDL